MLLDIIVRTQHTATYLFIRLMVGGVFLSEGIQKFLFADTRGAGRFASIGLPSAEIVGPLVGAFEIVCGILILIGLATRLATLPLIIIMLVAIVTTKLPQSTESGIWVMLHASRTDFSMLLGSLFLLFVGAGSWSVDNRLWTKRQLWSRYDSNFRDS